MQHHVGEHPWPLDSSMMVKTDTLTAYTLDSSDTDSTCFFEQLQPMTHVQLVWLHMHSVCTMCMFAHQPTNVI
jgi:hypothetical protein